MYEFDKDDPCTTCGGVFVLDEGCARCRVGIPIVKHLVEFIEADSVVDALAAFDNLGWTLEAPMRDRAKSLDFVWREDTRRHYLGIPSIWT